MPQQETTLADVVELRDEVEEREKRQQRERMKPVAAAISLPQVDAQCLHAARFWRQWPVVRFGGHQRCR